MTAPFTAAYVYDPDLRIRTNKSGRNYWYEYIREINDQLGLKAREVPRDLLKDRDTLSRIGILIIGDLTPAELDDAAAANLESWVNNGGILIGFGTEGLDQLFGNTYRGTIPQSPDDFSISGYFSLLDDPITTGVHSYLHPSQKLIILSPIRKVRPKSSTELARLYDVDGADAGCAAITKRELGDGYTFYFAFNVPQTIWVLHQGRPVLDDYDGDGYYRMSDARVIGDNEPEVLYADEILFLLQNMIGRRRYPMVYQIPPQGDKVPDALFYWGGDDERMAGMQLWASNWMKEHDLPYHVNIMPKEGSFSVTLEEFQAIVDNGHEPSLHYNFLDGYNHPLHFTQEDIQKQADLYCQTFGQKPICTVNHWTFWTGWAEPAKWMLAAGGKADNSRIHRGSPPLNPANNLGFSFGTSFPFYFYDDHTGRNARIDFLCEPITAYEVGYCGEENYFDLIHKVVDIAASYHLTMDMFYHSCNIARFATCREAVEEVLRYIEERGIVAAHMGNDKLWRWWRARTESNVGDVVLSDDGIAFTAECDHPDGFIARIPLGDGIASSATCDSSPAAVQTKREFGQYWAYVVLPSGPHRVEVKLGGLTKNRRQKCFRI